MKVSRVMSADNPDPGPPLRAAPFAGDTYAGWLQTAASLAGALGAIWQRLMFDRVLDLPPPLLAWTFWLLFVGSMVLHLRCASLTLRTLAWLPLAAAADYLWAVGLPRLGHGPELEEVRWRLAGWLSTAYFGLPPHALLAAVGILTWAWLCTQATQLRPLALGSGIVVLLFGATTVLGYATGSPWPFGV